MFIPVQHSDRTALAIIENLPDAVLVLDCEGRIQWASPSACESGFAPAGYMKHSATVPIHPDDVVRFAGGLDEAITHPGRAIRVRVRAMSAATRAPQPIEATFRFLPDEPGIHGVLVVIREREPDSDAHTPRGRASLSRNAFVRSGDIERESEEQLRQVVRLSSIGIWDHNHVTGEFYWSPEHRKIFGWGPDEPVTASNEAAAWQAGSVVHPQDRERASRSVKRAHDADSDGRFDLEYRIVRRDGSVRWIATRSQTFFEGTGDARRPVRTVGAVQDITEQKEAQRQLQLTKRAVDKCNTAIFWINATGQVTYANECACRSLGLSGEELVGRYVWDFDPDFPPSRWPVLWEQARRDKSITVESRHRRSDGHVFPVEAVGNYLAIDGEEHLFVFAQDATERQRAERERQLMHAAIDKSHTPFYAISPSGQIVYANDHACLMLGLTRDELIGRHLWDIDPGMDAGQQKSFWAMMKARGIARFETTHRRSDGTTVPVEITANFFSFKGEEFTFVFISDITERKKAERTLRESEERLRQAVLTYDIGIFEHDHVTDSVYCSPELRKYLGLEEDNTVNIPIPVFKDYVHPDDRERTYAAVARAHDPRGDGRYTNQYRVIRSDGSIRWFETRAQTFFEGEGASRRAVRTVGAIADITERHLMNHALKRSLHEKDTLLREVHHRVKNNLQIIASLLHFQAKKVRDPADLAAFVDGRNRLRSMILVHEKLYQSADLSHIEFGGYLQSLVRDLQRSYSSMTRHVDVRVCADNLALPIEAALPCGMILCELLTNVFKYAFPNARTGHAEVTLKAADGRAQLTVSDDGVGLPAGFSPEHATSFGWQLIRNLTTQLGGTATVGRGAGTHVTIDFPTPAPDP